MDMEQETLFEQSHTEVSYDPGNAFSIMGEDWLHGWLKCNWNCFWMKIFFFSRNVYTNEFMEPKVRSLNY